MHMDLGLVTRRPLRRDGHLVLVRKGYVWKYDNIMSVYPNDRLCQCAIMTSPLLCNNDNVSLPYDITITPCNSDNSVCHDITITPCNNDNNDNHWAILISSLHNNNVNHNDFNMAPHISLTFSCYQRMNGSTFRMLMNPVNGAKLLLSY